MSTIRKYKGPRANENVRELLLRAGIGQYNAQLALQYVWFSPVVCDPYAQGVMLLVQGLQNLLTSKGHPLVVDGGLGEETAAAIAKYAGADWANKTWSEIYSAVIYGNPRPAGFQAMRHRELDGYIATGELGPTDFCSTMNDQCKSPISGVCLPMNAEAVATFKSLQGQLNRVAAVKGWPLVNVDGRIGEKTVSLLERVLGITAQDCNFVAMGAMGFAAQVAIKANSAGAPTTVKPPASSKPSVTLADGTVYHPPGAREAWFTAMLKSPVGLAALVVGGLVLVQMQSKGRGKKSKKK